MASWVESNTKQLLGSKYSDWKVTGFQLTTSCPTIISTPNFPGLLGKHIVGLVTFVFKKGNYQGFCFREPEDSKPEWRTRLWWMTQWKELSIEDRQHAWRPLLPSPVWTPPHCTYVQLPKMPINRALNGVKASFKKYIKKAYLFIPILAVQFRNTQIGDVIKKLSPTLLGLQTSAALFESNLATCTKSLNIFIPSDQVIPQKGNLF